MLWARQKLALPLDRHLISDVYRLVKEASGEPGTRVSEEDLIEYPLSLPSIAPTRQLRPYRMPPIGTGPLTAKEISALAFECEF